MSEYSDRHATAVMLLSRGRPVDAERLLRGLLAQVHVRDDEYDEWLRTLVLAYQALGRHREAGWVLAYLGNFTGARASLERDRAAVDVARVLDLWARGSTAPDVASGLRREAAAAYDALGLPVQAAIAWAATGSSEPAIKAWERVGAEPALAALPYEQALSAYNLGLALRAAGRAEAADRQLARAQGLLEEVADDFESRGERERAFDCYAILLHLGEELGSFENLAEGYINCIRVLRADNLNFYALQYYEDFLRAALEREEFHAAATVCREAADYTRRLGMPHDRSYLRRAADAWWRAADKNERDVGPVDLSENALLSSIDAFAALGDFFRVRETYLRLARLGLPEPRRARYLRISERYGGVVDRPATAEPALDVSGQQHDYPPIWELDLVEWELGGEVSAVCALLVGDGRQPTINRRRALAVLLYELEGVRLGVADDPARLAALALDLGEIAYPALRPLEKLFGHPDAAVRRGVMGALRTLHFKRTFGLLGRGLLDPDESVQREARRAVESLHFAHAFDPLTRIFREHQAHDTRAAALVAIGRMATLEAGEFLIEVLRHEPDPLRDQARRLLRTFGNPDIFPVVRRYYEVESGPARTDLELLLRQTGN